MTAKLHPGRFSRAALHTEAGEAEFRLSAGGSWQLRTRTDAESAWRLLCSGNLEGSVLAPAVLDDGRPIALGPLRIDPAARRVEVQETPIPMAAREFDLLALLASDPHRVFTKRELLRRLWDYPDGCRTRTLESHASRLRVKLRRAGAGELIHNCHGVGYRLSTPLDAPAAAP